MIGNAVAEIDRGTGIPNVRPSSGVAREAPFDDDEARGPSGQVLHSTEILGAPIVELELSVDRPVALVAVRLNDVAPDGSSLRVTYGVLNLTHRDGHERPLPLEPAF